MDELEKLNALRLISTRNIGPITYSLLIARYGSATAAIDKAPQLASRQGAQLKLASSAMAKAIIKSAHAAGARLLIKGEADYPDRLMHFDDAPVALYAKGHLSLLKRDQIAIVGARNASPNAMVMTRSWAHELSKEGYVILSGLAKGIDRSAHIGGLEAGTVGVIGCGIDIIYPEENADLHDKMTQSGLIITEFAPGIKPSPRNFPARNRIIASLAKAAIIIEAAIHSGSLITAKESAERGAEIMAVPGSPSDARAFGTNQLIRDGAHLVTSPADVLAILRSTISEPERITPSFLLEPMTNIKEEDIKKLADEIMNILTFEATDIDELTRQCHVSAKVIQIALLELELAGHIQRLSGNRICKLLNYE